MLGEEKEKTRKINLKKNSKECLESAFFCGIGAFSFCLTWFYNIRYITDVMKSSYFITTLCSLCSAASFALAGQATIDGSADAANPSQFSKVSDWRSAPTFDNTLNVQLGAVEGGTGYYNVDGDFTVKQLLSESGVNGNFYITTDPDKKLTIDINSVNGVKYDAVLFEDGSLGTFTLGAGNYDIISSAGNQAWARLSTKNVNGAAGGKNFDIASGATINAYTVLSLSGTVGQYSSHNIYGKIYTHNKDTGGKGTLVLDWDANPYGTGGGTRTQVYVKGGGLVSTGELNFRVQARMTVEKGGKLEADNVSWTLSQTNPGGILTVQGNAVLGTVDFEQGDASDSGAAVVYTQGGVTDITRVIQNYYVARMFVQDGGTLNVSDSYMFAGGQLGITGGTANINNLTQSGNATVVADGSSAVLNLTGNGALTSSVAANNGGTINFKSGSSYTVSTLGASGGGFYNVEKGAKLTTSERFYFNGAAEYNVNGATESTMSGSSVFYAMEIASNATVKYGADSSFKSNTNARVNMLGKLIVEGAENSFKVKQFVFWGNKGVIDVGSKNPFVGEGGVSHDVGLNLAQQSEMRLIVRDTVEFGEVNLQGRYTPNEEGVVTAAKMTIELAFIDSDGYVSFNNFNLGDETARIYVENFASNRIKVKSATEKTIYLIDEFGNNINYEWVADTVNGGFWLNAVVPEPAEYAFILGAIAIAFALKRRCSRK